MCIMDDIVIEYYINIILPMEHLLIGNVVINVLVVYIERTLIVIVHVYHRIHVHHHQVQEQEIGNGLMDHQLIMELIIIVK